MRRRRIEREKKEEMDKESVVVEKEMDKRAAKKQIHTL